MAYKVIILYRLYMPSYFLGTFTEYPEISVLGIVVFYPYVRMYCLKKCNSSFQKDPFPKSVVMFVGIASSIPGGDKYSESLSNGIF